MKIKILSLLLLASLACTLTDNLTATPPPATETATLESAATAVPAGTAVKPDAPALDTTLTPDAGTPDSFIVCFANDYDGLVRVRECPGVGCREIAILPAGTALNLVETVSSETGTWAQINTPIQGWLNARYICGDNE
jgi:hypothetical protein